MRVQEGKRGISEVMSGKYREYFTKVRLGKRLIEQNDGLGREMRDK